jgi:hypothetical protein
MMGGWMISVEDIVDEYQASLLEPDEQRRLRILEQVWADDCEVILPEGRLVGRDAINQHISNVRRSFRGSTPILFGAIDAHNNFMRFEWHVVDPSGEVVALGVNIGERTEDGRLKRVILFRGFRPGTTSDT